MLLIAMRRYSLCCLLIFCSAMLGVGEGFAQGADIDEGMEIEKPAKTKPSKSKKKKKKPDELEVPAQTPAKTPASAPVPAAESAPAKSNAPTKAAAPATQESSPASSPAKPTAEASKTTIKQELKARYARNPVFRVGVHAQNAASNALNLFLGTDSQPATNNFGGLASFYLPEPEAVRWLNYFGIYYQTSSAQVTPISFLRATAAAPVKANLSGASQRAGLSIRIPFLDSPVAAIQMDIDLLNQFEESIEDIPEASGQTTNFTYRALGRTVNLGMELRPARNVAVGFDAALPVSQTVDGIEERSDGTRKTADGQWKRTQINFYGGFRYFAGQSLYFEGLGVFSYRDDQILAVKLTGVDEKSYQTNLFGAVLSAGYVMIND
jgi:hypothetical protein